MKPILFNTTMVHAILDNHKTVTRRVVKPRYYNSVFEMFRGELCEASPYKPPIDNGNGTTTHFLRSYVPCKAPYRPGQTLYVRETFRLNEFPWEPGKYIYKADEHPADWDMHKWVPSIHMPREAARIFLRVTNVRVERLQDIDDDGVVAEGMEIGAPFDELWDSTLKPADRALYGWDSNPWVWVIEFERVSKEGT